MTQKELKGSSGLKCSVSDSDFVAVTCPGLICSKCHNQAHSVLMAHSVYISLPFMTSMGHRFHVFTPETFTAIVGYVRLGLSFVFIHISAGEILFLHLLIT